MYNTPQVNGVGIHWGVSSTGLTGYGWLLLQSTTHNLESEVERVQDSNGYTVTVVNYDHKETATLETIITGSADSATVGITVASVPQPGDSLTVTDSTYTLVSGSQWICGNPSISRGNTTFAKVSIPLTRYAKIS